MISKSAPVTDLAQPVTTAKDPESLLAEAVVSEAGLERIVDKPELKGIRSMKVRPIEVGDYVEYMP